MLIYYLVSYIFNFIISISYIVVSPPQKEQRDEGCTAFELGGVLEGSYCPDLQTFKCATCNYIYSLYYDIYVCLMCHSYSGCP